VKLTREEREIIITKTDAEDVWHVSLRSQNKYARKLLEIASELGITTVLNGGYTEFDLPFECINLSGPRRVTAKQMANLRPHPENLRYRRDLSVNSRQKRSYEEPP